jgi:murein endopeptidase
VGAAALLGLLAMVGQARAGDPAQSPAPAAMAVTTTPQAEAATIERLEKSRWVVHRVAPRETLDQIAARYDVSLEAIARWNPDLRKKPKKREKIRIRARRIPPQRHPVEHVVQPGDTWWTISVTHGVDSRDLRAYNWRKNRTLVPDEVLQVWIDPVVFATVLSERTAPAWGVRAGAISIGGPNDGRLVNAVQLPESDLYRRKMPASAWGTTTTIRALVNSVSSFRQDHAYAGRVYISAISQPRGGVLGKHRSHQSGRDVDIRLLLREDIPQGLSPKPARRVDWLATYHLVRALVDTGDVVHVFLDYPLQKRMYRAAEAAGVPTDDLDALMQWPRGRRASRGIVRDSPGHDDHFHVRFRCGPAETECVALVPEGLAAVDAVDAVREPPPPDPVEQASERPRQDTVAR